MPSPALRFVFGLAFVACGMVAVLAALDIGPLHAKDINGPPWLGAVAGGVFLVGGVFLWAGDAASRHPWIGGLIAALLLAGLAAIGNWVAFGAGQRQCSGGFSSEVFITWQAAAIECRAAFGLGALMLDGMLIWMLGTGMRKLGMQGRLPVWIEKLGKGVLLLALAPILLVLIVFLLGKAFFESFLVYCRTGKWPRNEAFIARHRKGTQRSP